MNNLKKPLVGLLALVPFFSAIILVLIYLFKISILLTVIYFLTVSISIALLVFSYCAKCPCRIKHCTHWILGPLTKYFPKRKISPYNFFDYFGLAAAFLIIILFPQKYIYKNIFLLVTFWILIGITFYLILKHSCKICLNKFCGIKKLVT